MERNLAAVEREELGRRAKAFPGENSERVRKTWPEVQREAVGQNEVRPKSGTGGDRR